jgi:ubiquinone biosynthesis protein
VSTRRNSSRSEPVDNANGLPGPDCGRRPTTMSLFRRCGKIAAVVVHRCALVVWHATASRLLPGETNQAWSASRQLRLALEELGPTFVKFGQLLSGRSDITPPRMQEELSMLQDHAASMPQAKLVAELERNLGSQLSAVFATLEMVPVACGSIAQVHKGTLHNGFRVAVKVRRPGIRDEIDADFWLLNKLVRLVARVSSRLRAYDPVSILDEFAALLRAETDFTTEAQNLEVVRRTFEMSDTVTIPRVSIELSGESILVMDWIEGIALSDRKGLVAGGVNRSGLARAILQAYGVMIFQSDRFHADPHPGNLIAIKGERLGLIDFGEVGLVDPAQRAVLLQVITAVLGRNDEALADAVLSVSRTTRTVDRVEFRAQLATVLAPLADGGLKNVRIGELLGRLLHLLRHSGIVLPSDLAILVKTMIECEATTSELDPTVSLLNLASELGPIVLTLPTSSQAAAFPAP